jgi:8-oxo-dGTP pyrophosphatase MutT (NUDIX family)
MGPKKHGFQTLSEKLEYENPYMQVYRQEVKRPDGITRPYWVLDRKGDFSVVIPIFPDNTTVLVGQFRVPTKRYMWEFPMGMVAGATPLTTAKEELRQEAGLTAKYWEKLGYFYLSPGYSPQRSFVYIAREIHVGKSDPEEDEYLALKRVSIENVGQMIQDAKIVDAPSIIAYYYFRDRIQQA